MSNPLKYIQYENILQAFIQCASNSYRFTPYFKSFSFTLCFKVVGLNPVPTLKVFSIWKLVPNTVALIISSYEVATMQCCTLICWSILGFMHTQIVWSRARWDLKTTKSPDHLSILVIGWDGCRHRMCSGSPFFNAFIDLNPMAALKRSLVRVEKMKYWGVCTLKWCSPGCKRWTP